MATIPASWPPLALWPRRARARLARAAGRRQGAGGAADSRGAVSPAPDGGWSPQMEDAVAARVASLGAAVQREPERARRRLPALAADAVATGHAAAPARRLVQATKVNGAFFFVGLLGLYDLAIRIYPRHPPYWRVAYALLWLSVLGLVGFALLNTARVRSGQLRVLLAMAGITLAWMLPSVLRSEVYYVYLASDLALSAFFTLVFAAHVAFPDLFRDPRRLNQLLVLLLAGLASALVAEWVQLFPTSQLPGFPGPHLLIYPILLVAVWKSHGRARWALVALLLAALVLTTIAGKRSSIAAAFAVVLVGGFILLPWRRRLVLLLAALPAMLTAVHLQSELRSFIKEEAVTVVAAGRFSQLLNEGEDTSVEGRLGEASDVLAIVRHQSTPLQVLFGHGHGAVYAPTDSNVMSVFAEVNRVHHIHIGLFMFLFRYGLVGVLLYLGTIALVAYDTARVALAPDARRFRPGFLMLLLGMWVIAIYSVADHPLHDPLHAFFIVGYFCVRGRPERRSAAGVRTRGGGHAPTPRGRVRAS